MPPSPPAARPPRWIAAWLLVPPLLMSLLLGCGGSSQPRTTGDAVTAKAGSDGVQTVRVDGDDQLRFVPRVIRARPGMIRVEYVTVGAIPHTFTITSLNVDTGYVGRGQRKTLTFRVDRPGRYPITCVYHPTMTGTLEVT